MSLPLPERELQILFEVGISAALGAVIGLEREFADKPAGLRTQMLVAAAAALFVGIGDLLIEEVGSPSRVAGLRFDPIRIIEAVVTGVSFLGAGTIFRRAGRHYVEGLTTAASLLLTSGIGLAVGLGHYTLSIGVTALALFILGFLRLIERWIGSGGGRDDEVV